MGKPWARTLSRRDASLFRVLLFLARLAPLSVILYIVPLYPPLLYPLQEAVASNAHAILLALGLSAERSGTLIVITSGEPFAFYVGPDCTAWESMALFCALVLAVPGVSPGRRAAGILPGIIALYAANMARITSVAATGSALGEEQAVILHDVFWMLGLTATVLLLWAAWLYFCAAKSGRGRKKHIAGRTKNKLCA